MTTLQQTFSQHKTYSGILWDTDLVSECYCIYQPLRLLTRLIKSQGAYILMGRLILLQKSWKALCHDCFHQTTKEALRSKDVVFCCTVSLLPWHCCLSHVRIGKHPSLSKRKQNTLLLVTLHTVTYKTSCIYTKHFLSLVEPSFFLIPLFKISWLSDCLVLKIWH